MNYRQQSQRDHKHNVNNVCQTLELEGSLNLEQIENDVRDDTIATKATSNYMKFQDESDCSLTLLTVSTLFPLSYPTLKEQRSGLVLHD